MRFVIPCSLCLVILVSSSAGVRRSRQVSGGQERGGVGIQLPSIRLWPWSGDRRQRSNTLPRPQKKAPPPVSHRRQDVPDKRFTKPPPPGFKKKPTGLEKKPFGPKYPAKKINPKYQKYNKLVKPPQKKQVPVKKVRLAPIPDLRPTSIDRIDILRPQPQQNKQFPVRAQTPVNKPRGPPPPSSRVTPASRPAQTGIKIVPSKSSINRVDTNSLIEFNESPVEVNGLKLFMFRGDEGIGASQFQPFSASVSGHYTPQQLLFSQPSTPQLQYNNSPFQWSKAEIRPSSGSSSLSVVNTTPRYAINDVAPPFPTRHTTPSPHGDQPIVIIAQSNVAQN